MKVDNNVSEILVTKEKVLKLLKGVNSSKSAGADGIHPLSFFLYILPGARFRALSAGVHCTLRVAG